MPLVGHGLKITGNPAIRVGTQFRTETAGWAETKIVPLDQFTMPGPCFGSGGDGSGVPRLQVRISCHSKHGTQVFAQELDPIPDMPGYRRSGRG